MDDAANDVWSLGVVLFQMLACTVPGPQVWRHSLNPTLTPTPMHATESSASWQVQLLDWQELACGSH